jgi:hypothetical protein
MACTLYRWKKVERLTFYNWYSTSNSVLDHVLGSLGISFSWRKLKQITIYPVLANHDGIFRIRSHPLHGLPTPFIFMPHPSTFPLLKKFTIMIPAGWENEWLQYEKYAMELEDEQKALLEKVTVETKNGMWP